MSKEEDDDELDRLTKVFSEDASNEDYKTPAEQSLHELTKDCVHYMDYAMRSLPARVQAMYRFGDAEQQKCTRWMRDFKQCVMHRSLGLRAFADENWPAEKAREMQDVSYSVKAGIWEARSEAPLDFPPKLEPLSQQQ